MFIVIVVIVLLHGSYKLPLSFLSRIILARAGGFNDSKFSITLSYALLKSASTFLSANVVSVPLGSTNIIGLFAKAAYGDSCTFTTGSVFHLLPNLASYCQNSAV